MSAPPPSKLRQLWHLARTADSGRTRLFALAEMICLPISLVALASLLVTASLRAFGVEVPIWWARYVLPISCTAAVGYMTNYIAVRMLFEPYSREEWHWLRLVTLFLWRRGLIPTRKSQLADAAGKEVGERLLTPQAITEELSVIAESALDDPHFRDKIREALPGLVRSNLPGFVAKITPELRALLGDKIGQHLGGSRLKDFLQDVAAPWLNAPANREVIVSAIVQLLQEQTPRMVNFLRSKADQMANDNQMLGFFVKMAEGAGIWDGIGETFRRQIASPDGRREIDRMLDDLFASMWRKFDDPEMRPMIEQAQRKIAEHIGSTAQDFLEREAPERAAAFLERDEFWHWVAEELIPKLKPALVAWIREEGHDIIGKKFDVAGRVRGAIEGMDVRAVHGMVDRVATEQLGAIQVLGFVLGLLAGIPLVLLL